LTVYYRGSDCSGWWRGIALPTPNRRRGEADDL
jgi:hypothetical protein